MQSSNGQLFSTVCDSVFYMPSTPFRRAV